MRVDHDTAPYWAGCARRELVIARCNGCGHWIHPPRGVCPSCLGGDIGHQPASGQASVYSFVCRPGVDGRPAPTTVWAELVEQEGLIVIGDLAGDGPVKIDDSLTLCWSEAEGQPVPAFRRADAA